MDWFQRKMFPGLVMENHEFRILVGIAVVIVGVPIVIALFQVFY